MARKTASSLTDSESPSTEHGNGTGNGSAADPMASMTEMWTAYTESCSKLQQEMTRFVGERVECDAEAIQALAGCKDMASAVQVQLDWLNRSSQMYADELTRMSDIATRMRLPGWPTGD